MTPTSAPEQPACRLAPGVYLARQMDLVRIFELNRGRFYGLDVIDSRLLLRAMEQGPDGAAADVALMYGAEPSEVRGDLDVLFNGLRRRGLLASDGPARPDRPHRWLPGPCRVEGPVDARLAARLLRRAWWSLRLDGWAGNLARWGRPAGLARAVPLVAAGPVIAAVDAAVRRAAAASRFCRAACKERALVGHHLLRAVYGLPSTLVVGVQHHPFAVHAWVEIEGQVVTDEADHAAGFEPVARFS
jgi:hypothetical protein